MNEREIFLVAIEIADPTRRKAYLDEACADNAELRAQVEELLKTHEETSLFLETPARATDSSVEQTILTGSSDSDNDPGAELNSSEADFRKFLEPATRPGWLGRLAHYEIEEILGRGAFGIVAKAFDEKLHRVVAVKLMSPELATTSPPRKRFLREARTAAAVTHENIVAIHAVEEEPIPYLVMEYIPGQTLQQRMDEHGPLEVREILQIGQQVAAGLAAAHAVNLIHRDIKPSNLLLSFSPTSRVKISDFGLARAVDDASLTTSGMIAGTPMYMAPEQARGETLDHRADLFSLGSVLYRAASGRPPFRAANTVAVLKRVCEDTPRPLGDVLPGTPDWLEAIIFKLLEKDRDDRYQTAEEVANLLIRYQRELENNDKVTSVEGLADTAETQVLQKKKSTGSGSKKKPLGWLVGGVIAVGTVIGLVQMNGEKETLVSETPNSSDKITSISTTEPPKNPAKATTGQAPLTAAISPFDVAQGKAYQEAWAKHLGLPVNYENSIGMKFRLIPPGEFTMGSPKDEIENALLSTEEKYKPFVQSEEPQHKVILTEPFYLSTTEVTQSCYEEIMEANPSQFSSSSSNTATANAVKDHNTTSHPVEGMTWLDAAQFCEQLSYREGLAPQYVREGLVTLVEGIGYRLPTEAEWEFACRAGTTTRYWCGDNEANLFSSEWIGATAKGRTHSVGRLPANPFGLFDMHGNVWEWTQDHWEEDYYSQFKDKVAVDPTGPANEDHLRVIRGGHQYSVPSGARSASRYVYSRGFSTDHLGFRALLSVDGVKQSLRNTPMD